MDYDEDYAYGLTQIEWGKKQRKDLSIGFTILGLMLLCGVGAIVWLFA